MVDFMTSWDRYERLMKERPELFVQSDELKIITDRDRARRFSEETGKTIGVVYESAYSFLVVDLVESGGRCFTYERMVPANLGGIVSLPIYNGKIVLLKQFRHAIRTHQLALPRGFGEAGITAEENLKKEIQEELGADVIKSSFLGKVYTDSGITSACINYFSCEITAPTLKKGYEGICELVLLTREEFSDGIRSGLINDSFTINAWAMFSANEKE